MPRYRNLISEKARYTPSGDGLEAPDSVIKAADRTSAIGTKQTCSMRRRMSAFGGKADSDQPLLTNLDL